MQLYPAIDIKDGRCVRLTQGAFHRATVYSEDPVRTARRWQSQGATYLHLVDLDGALAGRSVNEEVIRSVVRAVDIPVELGGGIRTEEAARTMIELGVARVIVGTRAAREPRFMELLADRLGPERVAAGIDARDGMVAVEGWEEVSQVTALGLCRRMKSFGIRHIIYTDISRDGTLTGPNVEATGRLARETGLDIIASGGISAMEDLKRLSQAGICGAVIGKALYEKRFSLREAVEAFQK